MLFTEDAGYYARQVKERKVTVLALVDQALANIEALNPRLNAIVYVQASTARAQAKEYDGYLDQLTEEEIDSLPDFFGVPTLLKDLGQHQAGHLTASGSNLTKDMTMQVTEYYVENIINAGFVIIGRTNVPEFGFKGISDSKAFGQVNNPIDLNRNPGGSSGGAAAALKAGIVPLAFGSDGGGSIRIPASFSGLIGLKPSRGRVAVGPGSYRGWQGASINFALTKSVDDTWTLLRNLQVEQLEAPFIMPIINETSLKPLNKPLKIGYLDQLNQAWPINEDAKEALKQTIQVLRKLGHEVFKVTEPFDRAETMRNYFVMNSVETAAMMKDIEQASGHPVTFLDVEPLTWAIYRAGLKVPSYRYSQLLTEWDKWTAQSEAMFEEEVDLLLTPTTNGPAPIHGQFDPDNLNEIIEKEKHFDDYEMADQQGIIWEHFAKSVVHMPYTSSINMLGQPAISLPLYKNKDHLPVGIQFIAQKGNDYLLLQLAKQFENQQLLDTAIVNL